MRAAILLKKSVFITCLIGCVAGCSTPPAAPPGEQPGTVVWQDCPPGHAATRCGTLRVYENRLAQTGRMIDLYLEVYAAASSDPAPDPIFYLAGGPGSAATEDAAKGPQFPSALSRTHDLVYVDQRGTGRSHQVLIPPAPDLSGLSAEQAMATMQPWAAQFLAEIDMEPRFYTTWFAMEDLDQVRAALGYDQINLFGHSYGATAAQYYLRQHAEHVRSVVLSGATLLDTPVFEVWARNGQRALDLVFARCADDAACQAAFPDLRQEFAGLMARMIDAPAVQEFTNPADGQPGRVLYTADLLAEIVREMTLDVMFTARLPRLIHQAYAENEWTGITDFYLQYGTADWGAQIMEHVIRCSEKWADFSPEAVVQQSGDSYLTGWYTALAYNHAQACQLTPPGELPEGRAAQPGADIPILILNGEADPQAPPENMDGYQALWPNSLLVVEPYQGHWLSDWSEISCRWSIEAEFIEQASVAGLDTSCLQRVTTPPFDVRG